jgi:hypothetical protein
MVLPLEENTMRDAIDISGSAAKNTRIAACAWRPSANDLDLLRDEGPGAAMIFEDAGVSGGKALATRPAGAS